MQWQRFVCAVVLAASVAMAQERGAQGGDVGERLKSLEERNAALEQKVQQLSAARGNAVEAKAAQEGGQQGAPAAKEGFSFKDFVKSGDPLRFYGFFRLDAYYDTARSNNVILPAYVLPENGIVSKPGDNEFDLDPRLTRIGLDVNAGQVGDAKTTGKLELDFANFPTGSTESRATPRIRLAYADLDFGQWSLRFGQDWDVISPLYPSVNSELLMWNAGNTGDRRPQVQVAWKCGSESDYKFDVRASAGLTGAIDNQDLDVGANSQRDGFDAGVPHGQARAGFEMPGMVEKKPIKLGLWGALGRMETDARFNGKNRFNDWIAGIDWTLPLCDCLAWRGEQWLGQALADFRGGVAQSINTTLGEEIQSYGGWTELVWDACPMLKLVGGGSYDNPKNSDLPIGGRTFNWTGYGAAIVNWGGGFKTGYEVIYWETNWVGLGIGNMVRLDFYAQLDW